MKLDIKQIISMGVIFASILGVWFTNSNRISNAEIKATENSGGIVDITDKVNVAILEGQRKNAERDKKIEALGIHAEYTRKSVDMILKKINSMN